MAYLMNYEEYQKYNRPGIYSISIIYEGGNRKLLYIGKSVNMYRRICRHVREITKDWNQERKYQLLHNFWLTAKDDTTNNRRIQFDVVEYCDDKSALLDIEAEYIDYFKPPLNTVGMTDEKTIDERIADNEEIFWLLELPGSWFSWEN